MLAQHTVFMICLYWRVKYFIPFYRQIIFHYMGRTHFIYSLISQCAFGLFVLFSYSEQCSYEHLCTGFSVSMFSFLLSVIQLEVELLDEVIIPCLAFPGAPRLFSRVAGCVNHCTSHPRHVKAARSSHPHQHVSSWAQPSSRVWSGGSWLWFIFSSWLMMLNISSYAYWLLMCLLWSNVCWGLLPTFNWVACFTFEM